MENLPSVTGGQSQGDYRVRLVFNDGLEAVVDFEDWLHGPIFQPVQDLGYFERFFIEAGTIAWPNGADIAPETLYERAKSANAV